MDSPPSVLPSIAGIEVVNYSEQVFISDEDDTDDAKVEASPFIYGRFSPAILKASRPETLHLRPVNGNNGIVGQSDSDSEESKRFIPRKTRHNACIDSPEIDADTADIHPYILEENLNDIPDHNEDDQFIECDEDFNRNPLAGYSDDSPNTDLTTKPFQELPHDDEIPVRGPSPGKRVSFRCGNNLVEVLEIPSRFDMIQDEENFIKSKVNNNNNTSEKPLSNQERNSVCYDRFTKSAKPRLRNGGSFHPNALLPKRAKSTSSRQLHEQNNILNKTRIVKRQNSKDKPISKSNTDIYGNKTTSGLSNFGGLPPIKNNKTGKYLGAVSLNPYVNLNLKYLNGSGGTRLDKYTKRSSTLPHFKYTSTSLDTFQSEDDGSNDMTGLQNGLRRCSVGSLLDNDRENHSDFTNFSSEYDSACNISRDRMLAWNLANSGDLGENRTQPQIVPLYQ